MNFDQKNKPILSGTVLLINAKGNALTYYYLNYNLRMLNVDSPQNGEQNEFISYNEEQ